MVWFLLYCTKFAWIVFLCVNFAYLPDFKKHDIYAVVEKGYSQFATLKVKQVGLFFVFNIFPP